MPNVTKNAGTITNVHTLPMIAVKPPVAVAVKSPGINFMASKPPPIKLAVVSVPVNVKWKLPFSPSGAVSNKPMPLPTTLEMSTIKATIYIDKFTKTAAIKIRGNIFLAV